MYTLEMREHTWPGLFFCQLFHPFFLRLFFDFSQLWLLESDVFLGRRLQQGEWGLYGASLRPHRLNTNTDLCSLCLYCTWKATVRTICVSIFILSCNIFCFGLCWGEKSLSVGHLHMWSPNKCYCSVYMRTVRAAAAAVRAQNTQSVHTTVCALRPEGLGEAPHGPRPPCRNDVHVSYQLFCTTTTVLLLLWKKEF